MYYVCVGLNEATVLAEGWLGLVLCMYIVVTSSTRYGDEINEMPPRLALSQVSVSDSASLVTRRLVASLLLVGVAKRAKIRIIHVASDRPKRVDLGLMTRVRGSWKLEPWKSLHVIQ